MRSEKNLFYRYLAQTSPTPLALDIVSAHDAYLVDSNGKKYLDFISGISVSNVGHSHPSVVKAVQEQAASYMHLMVYGEYVQSPQVKLAEKICSLLPPHLNTVYYTNSGAEAVEGAIKTAKRFTGRSEILSFVNAYHGSTHGALSLMGNEKLKQPFRPLLPGIKHLRFNELADLELIGHRTAAVIVEVIQAEAGIILPKNNFLQALAEACRKVGALLIVDEIQTGMGRTGKMFAFEHYNISPDIITLAKAFGGGMPLGAFIASNDIMAGLSNPPLGHITTFGGHPVCCAAALAALNIINSDEVLPHVEAKGELIKQKLANIGHPISGKGLFLCIDFGNANKNFKTITACLHKGLITDWFLFADHKMRLAPPLTISNNDIELACDIIIGAAEKV